MTLIGIAYEAGVIIASAIFAASISYNIFRESRVALWSYLAAFIPRAIIVLVSLTGATNLYILTWLSHTAGIFVYPLLLSMANILLYEVTLANIATRKSSLPIHASHAKKIQNFLSSLQSRKLIPNYAEVKHVYIGGVLAGTINLVFVYAFGLL